MKRKTISKLFFAVFLVAVVFMGICEAILVDNSSGIVRLHVIANSDSEKDQTVKLAVRDALLSLSEELSGNSELSLAFADEHKAELTAAANAVLLEHGCNYSCEVVTGNFHFPTKSYENITLPEGDYDAVRVVLGTGSGQNWWCVMYPPLCFTDSAKGAVSDENKEKLSELMGSAEYQMISDENIQVKPAFKAVEIWQSLKEKASQTLDLSNKRIFCFD